MNLTINDTNINLELTNGQGPSGVIGSNYAVRIDQVSSSVIYRAEALAGSAEGSAVWRIQKITISGDDVTIQWADGVSTFTKIWTNRLSYTYS